MACLERATQDSPSSTQAVATEADRDAGRTSAESARRKVDPSSRRPGQRGASHRTVRVPFTYGFRDGGCDPAASRFRTSSIPGQQP